MIRKLLLLLAFLSGPALAATNNIVLSISYTSGAATAAGGAAALQSQVQNLITSMNGAFGTSGADVNVTASFTQAGHAPADSAAMLQQYAYVRNTAEAWQYRGSANFGAGASISVHISAPDPNVVTTGLSGCAGSQAINLSGTRNSVIALPYAFLGGQFENAVAKCLGAGPGVDMRQRLLDGDPEYSPIFGGGYCRHTREYSITGNEISNLVPFKSYWWTNSLSGTRRTAQADSCENFRTVSIANGAATSATFASSQVIGNYCWIKTNTGTYTNGTGYTMQFVDQSATPPAVVDCVDSVVLNCYASASARVGGSPNCYTGGRPDLPLSGAVDSVASINARAPAIVNFKNYNTIVVDDIKTLWWYATNFLRLNF